MKLRLIMIGRTEKGFVADAFDHYIDRIIRSEKLEISLLGEAGHGDASYQQKVEGERLVEAVRPGEKLVLLDERGKQFTSPAFADRLQTWRDQGVRTCTFAIGGAYGFSEEVKKKADLLLSLSAMTFPHQLVRVLFAEQLYRAFSIMKGSPYHH